MPISAHCFGVEKARIRSLLCKVKSLSQIYKGRVELYFFDGNAHLKVGCQSMNTEVWQPVHTSAA